MQRTADAEEQQRRGPAAAMAAACAWSRAASAVPTASKRHAEAAAQIWVRSTMTCAARASSSYAARPSPNVAGSDPTAAQPASAAAANID